MTIECQKYSHKERDAKFVERSERYSEEVNEITENGEKNRNSKLINLRDIRLLGKPKIINGRNIFLCAPAVSKSSNTKKKLPQN